MKLPTTIPIYGDTRYRGKCPKESSEQITFFNKLRKEFPEIGNVALHVKNEGKKHHAQVSKDKVEGMCPGASDINIAGSPAFVCELKRLDHTQSSISDEQVKYLNTAQKLGAFACVALGWEAAFEAFLEWKSIIDSNRTTMTKTGSKSSSES